MKPIKSVLVCTFFCEACGLTHEHAEVRGLNPPDTDWYTHAIVCPVTRNEILVKRQEEA